MKNNDFKDLLNDHSEKNTVSFHMPGHKGRIKSPDILFDVTETDFTDNIYDPRPGGAVSRSLDRITSIYGSAHSVITPEGSTMGIKAAIRSAILHKGTPRILSVRNVHRSAVYAFSHTGAQPEWIVSDRGSVTASDSDIISAISDCGDCAAVLITSPDYYGTMHDSSSIATAAAKAGMFLIVDCAHGAHLDFWKDGSMSPVRGENTLAVQSLHKTLPALTGAAVLHSSTDISLDDLLDSLRVYCSTSPSFLISASAFDSIDFMNVEGRDRLDILYSYISCAKEKLKEYGFVFENRYSDPFRIVLGFTKDGVAGSLYNHLYSNGIEAEFYDRKRLVLIPSVMNTEKDFNLLLEAVKTFSGLEFAGSDLFSDLLPPEIPEKVMSVREALLHESELVNVSDSEGRISAEPVSMYPPGTALLFPGEMISGEYVSYLREKGFEHVKVIKVH